MTAEREPDELDRMLVDAAGALRAETAGPAAAALSTRARVLATHRARSERATRVTTWIAMAAAAFLALGGSTAWAYWTGRLDRWLAPAETPSDEREGREERETPGERRAATRPPEAPVVEVVEEVAPEAPAVDEAAASVPSSVAEPRAESGAVGVAAEREEPRDDEGPPVDPTERRAYRAAHALHFEAHDPEGAIAAWDGYLHDYPRGRFALEARYNRALCLVRVGRQAEARAALEPFARGTHGGYRQAEATALLEALDAP